MVIKVAMQFPFDTALPRDVITVTPHYNGNDAAALVGLLLVNLNAWTPTANKPVTLKAYDAMKAPPSYPIAQLSQSGTPPSSATAREVALCLSYYATYNRPSYRGRLYLPCTWFTSAPQLRPTTAIQNKVLEFATSVLAKNLPSGHFWTMYSPTRRLDAQVSDVWCDDEWDTVRSRGMKPTSRVTAHIT